MTEYQSSSLNGKSISKHRKLWIKFYGSIPSGMIIHHINGNKKDNRLENLECISRKEHRKKHKKDYEFLNLGQYGFQKGNKLNIGKTHHLGHRHSLETIERIREAKLKNPTRYWLGKKRSVKV